MQPSGQALDRSTTKRGLPRQSVSPERTPLPFSTPRSLTGTSPGLHNLATKRQISTFMPPPPLFPCALLFSFSLSSPSNIPLLSSSSSSFSPSSSPFLYILLRPTTRHLYHWLPPPRLPVYTIVSLLRSFVLGVTRLIGWLVGTSTSFYIYSTLSYSSLPVSTSLFTNAGLTTVTEREFFPCATYAVHIMMTTTFPPPPPPLDFDEEADQLRLVQCTVYPGPARQLFTHHHSPLLFSLAAKTMLSRVTVLSSPPPSTTSSSSTSPPPMSHLETPLPSKPPNDRPTETHLDCRETERDAPGSPVEKVKSKPGGGGTKGKWLKLTRKGLLITAMTRVGKQEERTERERRESSKPAAVLPATYTITTTTYYHHFFFKKRPAEARPRVPTVEKKRERERDSFTSTATKQPFFLPPPPLLALYATDLANPFFACNNGTHRHQI